MNTPPAFKIWSGGQTGVDRAALDCALALGIPHGGWCPQGRIAADGVLDARYLLQETRSSGYRQRTKLNVQDTDATMLINVGPVTGGSLQTIRFAASLKRPYLVIQVDQGSMTDLAEAAVQWLQSHRFSRVNFAGPSEARCPGIYAQSVELLMMILPTLSSTVLASITT